GHRTQGYLGGIYLLTFNIYRTRGLAASPRSWRKIAGQSKNSVIPGDCQVRIEHSVIVVGGGPTGLLLAGELALAGIDVAIAERRANQELVGSRAGGLHSRTIEMLDQRGIADRFLTGGQVAQVAGFSQIRLDISDFPTRHPYGLALWQNHIERILADWVSELTVPIYRGCEVSNFTQDRAGVDVKLAGGQFTRPAALVGYGRARSVGR